MDKKDALERLQRLCSKSERCISDVKKKLNEWKVQEDQEEIISSLVDMKYIDEQRFSNAFVHDKCTFSKWGRYKIKYHLCSKRISDEIIDKALTTIDDQAYTEMVFAELSKKWNNVKLPEKRRNALFSFSAQRGYEQELIYRWIDEKNIS
jgi:regulatory protein